MRKKKKSCGCNTQNNSCNTKNMNYCTKKEDVYQDKCSCVKPSDKCGCTKPMDKYNYTKPTDKCSCTKPVTEYNPKSCIPNTNINSIDSCKPTKCKPKIKEYTCPCEDCEITCEDKCADLAQRAEELFNKAMKYEEKAKCALKEAKELEQNAKCLSQKSCNLMQNAKEADKGSKNATCSAQELMNKAEELCCKAKCLYKEAKELEQEAAENCQNAKCAYEKAENYNAQAKYLYNQTLKYEQKTLECYKDAEEKIKEMGSKPKKCEDLINKCNSKLNNCMTSCVQPEQTKKSCGCNIYDKKPVNNCGCTSKAETYGCQSCEEEIIQVAPEQQQNTTQSNNCGCMCETEYEYSYVNPMYDMTPMQYMGNMSNQYMTMETPYIMPFDDGDSMNDMWNNYYMYIQKMIQSMND